MDSSRAQTELAWGRRYAAVRPSHFRVDYRINPFMDLRDQPDRQIARAQWDAMVAAIETAGGQVDILEQRLDSPDMVYAMNLGLAVTSAAGDRVVMSHMRFDQRRQESESSQAWFAGAGFVPSYIGRGGIGAHFEAGDAFAFGGRLVVGYGPRTDELALKHLATDLGVNVTGLRITHPGMYHLDLAFCPLDSQRAIVCPEAFDEASVQTLLDLVPEPLVITESEAMTFCANSIVVGRTVIMPACPVRLRTELQAAGFDIVIVDVSQFHKGGGSVRCLTNPLDVMIGRDLESCPGGHVDLPADDWRSPTFGHARPS
jgi:N-dimethylarginine dimethylaminohydrolase